MRIGIDARLWNETGVGRYIQALFAYLPKDQEIIWFLGPKEFANLQITSAKWRKVLATPRWHTLSEQIIMPILFYRENLDLLHVPYVNFPAFYFRKTVSTIHDLILDHYKTGKATTLPWWGYLIKKVGYQFLVWVATRRAAKIIAVSYSTKKEIIDHYQVNPERIEVIYESGELSRASFKSLSPENRRPKGTYLLYVGNAHPHKNLENLIRAAEILKKKLVLVGSDSYFYPRLSRSQYVYQVGSVPNEELFEWYKNAAVFVSASKMEGFGIPPLEAMSAGCPVALSDIPIFREINGEAAVYFNPDNPEDIARVISQVLMNRKLRQSLISKGYKQAKKYSWEKMVRETYKIYESCSSL